MGGDRYCEAAATVAAADTGTIYVSMDGGGQVWIGLRAGNTPCEAPRLRIRLTARQLATVRDALEMYESLGREAENGIND